MKCSTCSSTMKLTAAAPASCVCLQGFFNGTKCEDCPQGCSTCENAQKCTDCVKPYVIPTGGNLCECDFANGYYAATDGSCKDCHNDCKTCHGGTAAQCDECKSPRVLTGTACACGDGKYYNKGDNSCKACHATCLSCDSATNCIECAVDMNKKETTTGKALCECDTSKGVYQKDGKCISCHDSCKTCNGGNADNCVTCDNQGYEQVGTKCEAIPVCTENQFVKTTASPWVCGDCHDTCATCTGEGSTKCTKCVEGMGKKANSNEDCKCSNGTYFTAGNTPPCLDCPVTCKTCTSATTCGSCIDGAVKDTTGTCVCDFVNGYFVGVDGKCEKCHDTCKKCSGPEDIECTECKAGATFDEDSGRCQEVSECDDLYFLNTYTNTGKWECKRCDQSCLRCSNESEFACTACNSPLEFSAPTGSTTGQCICPDGTYMQGSTCKDCDVGCATCERPGECITCTAPFDFDI